jgi:protein-tyrosine phosphatase
MTAINTHAGTVRRRLLRGLACRALLAGAALLIVAGVEQPRFGEIPFTAASVSTELDGSGHLAAVASWRAVGVHSVAVHAGRNPGGSIDGATLANGSAAGSVTIPERGPAPVWYFTLVPDRGMPLTIADRSLHLVGAANFRDVGGYRTRSGAWVRMGLAYRSNELDRLTPADFTTLAGLKLNLVCDLRTSGERTRAADMVPPGVTRITADVLADDGPKLRALMGPVQPGVPAAPRPSAEEIYRDFVDLPSARSAYHVLFVSLADRSRLPMVFHCSAGKDRSGWAAAILLTILDVPHATVVDDYMLTDRYLRGDNLEHLRAQFNTGGNAAAALSADASNLAAAFDEVSRRYGSFATYLHDGLGLDDATLAAIRRNFLVGGPPPV